VHAAVAEFEPWQQQQQHVQQQHCQKTLHTIFSMQRSGAAV
jgi:hypothetical protein